MKQTRYVPLHILLVVIVAAATGCTAATVAPAAPTAPPAKATAAPVPVVKTVIVTPVKPATLIPAKSPKSISDPTVQPVCQGPAGAALSCVFSDPSAPAAALTVTVPWQGFPLAMDNLGWTQGDVGTLKEVAERYEFRLHRPVVNFQIRKDGSSALLYEFKPAMGMQVQYTQADLDFVKGDPTKLHLAFYDPIQKRWKIYGPNQAYVDRQQRTIFVDGIAAWGDAFIVMGDCMAGADAARCGAYPVRSPTPTPRR